jgi:group I intron endonuclease
MTCGIYLINHKPSGRKYVGQSIDVARRFTDHKRGKEPTLISRAINKYGVDEFEFTLLEECPQEDLDRREREFITSLNTLHPRGFNMTEGGQTSQGFAPAVRQALSEKMRERMRDPDYKQKVIEAVRTREITEGYRETQRRGTIKQFEDPTNREKHANLTKAQMADPKARSRISETLKKHFKDPENRKRCATRVGSSPPEDVRERIGAGSKRAWDNLGPEERKRRAEKGWETRRKNRIEQGNQREQVG